MQINKQFLNSIFSFSFISVYIVINHLTKFKKNRNHTDYKILVKMVFPHKRNFAQHIVSRFLILDKYSVNKTLTNILQIFIKKDFLFFLSVTSQN